MICKGCIKQDVCKYKKSVSADKSILEIDEPLQVTCKYKEVWDECPDNPEPLLKVSYPYGCPAQTSWTDAEWCGTTDVR